MDEAEIEAAAEQRLAGAELPDCEECASAVAELASYLMTARATGGKRVTPDGAPAASAVRELRRSSYVGRALRQVARLGSSRGRR